ncbi:MAG: dihydroorotate dehydrogenase [Firmicutes bacterium]|nr:dihydroorotate dehydrogenase [Bacillota bacterium]
MADLGTAFAGLQLKNPLLTASGTCGYGRELAQLFDLSLLGGICVKGTTLEPRLGNPPPRIMETAGGLLNSVGLQNPGVEKVIEEEMPFLRQFDTAVVVNIAGHQEDDYRLLAEKLDAVPGIAALEVNISCPNVKNGGMAFGTQPETAARITSLVRRATSLPVIVKLSPNVTDICEIAKAVEAAGADAVSLINTLLGMAIDVEKQRPFLANITGGLSGPALKPVALRMVWQTYRAVSIPIIGMGGICNAKDALEFMLAGASAFQIGAAAFHNPLAAPEILAGLDQWLDGHGVAKISDIIGAAQC